MEEDIKILENVLKTKQYGLLEMTDTFYEVLENLLTGYKQLEEKEYNKFKKIIEYEKTLEKLQKETIWKSKVKEKIEELSDKDLEIYETDSEDVIISKYEDRAVLDFCNSILED